MNDIDLSKFIGGKIKYFREMRNLTQEEVASELNTTRQTLSRYETGDRKANQDVLFDLAELFNITINDFFPSRKAHNISYVYNQLNDLRQKNVYSFAENQLKEQNEIEYHGQTAAGSPIEGEQVPVIYGDDNQVRLLVNGDSMEPLYHSGGIITYRKQETLENGEIGVFVVDGGVTMKKFKITDNVIKLLPLNDDYDPIIIDGSVEFTILGKVIK